MSNFGLTVNFSKIAVEWGTTTTPSIRRGMMIAKSTGSPQLALEPVERDPDFYLIGDMWFLTSGSARGQGLYYADTSSTAGTAIHKILTSRDIDTTPGLLINRYYTFDRPNQMHVGVNAVAADNWYYTVVPTGSMSSSGWLNTTFGGGFWFPTTSSMEIIGPNMGFNIPSGTLTVGRGLLIKSGSVTIATGSLNIAAGGLNLTGSLNLLSGSVTIRAGNMSVSGTGASLIVAGAGAVATIRGNAMVSVMLGAQPYADLVVSSSLFSDGTVYINSASLEISTKVNGSWYLASSGSLSSTIDGGFW